MSGKSVNSPTIGLFGKLPAHGDFVRRGGPAGSFVLLDRWIEAEATSESALTGLDGVRLAFVADDGPTLAAMIASSDRVGRRFPAMALLTGSGGVARDAAERWCAAAASALGAARDARRDAGAAFDAIVALDPPVPADGDGAAGWWRAAGAGAVDGDGLPRGSAFAAMLAGAP